MIILLVEANVFHSLLRWNIIKSDDSLIFDHSHDDNARPKRVTSHRVPSTEHRVGSFLAALFFQNGGRLQYVIGISFPFLDGVVNLLFFCYWGYTEGKTSIKNVRKK